MSENKRIYQVDAFTSEPFKGNPAGVCILGESASTSWMQKVAAEMNVSETAFIIPGTPVNQIRFFSPVEEVPLCGHATLAAAHIMFEKGCINRDEEIVFSSKAGELRARLSKRWITMDFPAFPIKQIPVPQGVEKIIGVRPVEMYSSSYGWKLVLINVENELRTMKPDFNKMMKNDLGHLIVTAPSSETNFDFSLRCFVPSLGIYEDPVPGSANCILAPFWHMKTNRSDFIVQQVSNRTGVMKISLKDNRVEISGQAKTVFRATLLV